MRIAHIFDVDGTLTPSRSTIDPGFRDWFLRFQDTHDTYLVTGSDYAKTVEQVGIEICDRSKLLFNCCGNEVRRGQEIIHQETWNASPELIEALEGELEICSFRLRTGNHIEMRTGLINFSVVGRNADRQQRAEYVAYDSTRFERRSIVNRLSERFHDLEFAIAGETGIDIYPVSRSKAQIVRWISAKRKVFFGDAIWPGGNDWTIASVCDEHHLVRSWEDTRDLLVDRMN